jgi:VanZ family protein
MAVIFWLSSRTASQSSLQSNAVLQWLIAHFGDGFFTDFIVRKLAHCLEFTGLCFLMNISLYYTRKKPSQLFAIALTSLYAVSDELHQIFVDGRACKITDWAIDTAGAIIGAMGFTLIFLLVKRISEKRKNH